MINSYHKGYEWTDDLVNSVEMGLKKTMGEFELFVEYMDTKRIRTPSYIELFGRVLNEKYSNNKLDLIFVSDDNAFQFILKYHQALFPNVPVVFMGVNDFSPSMISNKRFITGVVQSVDISDTIKIAKGIYPNLRNIALIFDDTPTGRGYRNQALNSKKIFPEINFIELDGHKLRTPQMFERLMKLHKDTIALLCIWVRDSTGRFVPWKETYPEIMKYSPVPVFGVIDYMLEYGVVGGMVQSAKYHALEAVEIANTILNGIPPNMIPVRLKSKNIPLFNYKALKRWDIPEDKLPPDSIIINRPKGLYTRYKTWIFGIGAFIVFLVSIIFILWSNIIKRRNVEKKLSERETMYRSLFELSFDAISITKEDGRIIDVNDRWSDIFGYTRDEIKNVNANRLWQDPSERERWKNEIISKGFLINYEMNAVTKDGVKKDILMSTRVKRDNDGNLIYYNILRDVTQEKRTKEALNISEEKFSKVFQSTPDAICISEFETGRYIDVNDAFCRITGWSRDEVIGKTSFDIKVWDQPDDREKAINILLKEGRLINYEIAFKGKNGNRLYALWSAELIEMEGKKYIISIIKDITDKKELEKQLLHAQKMEAVGVLAGGIAHDFNNILQAILGYTQLLLFDKKEDSPDFLKLKEIENSSKRASELVKRLLIFSRKVEINPRPIDLNRYISDSEKLLRRVIPRMIEIDVHLTENLPLINSDPAQIDQIIMNLAVNARDAMPDGGRLTIETRKAILDEEFCKRHLGALPGEYVLLSISDTGIGMEKDIIEHIFEPFFTTKETGKGTGLGLATVYGIVKEHEGYITCYSEPGHGTTFNVYFPCIPFKPGGKIIEITKELPKGSGEIVLLVDDEEYIRELGKNMLERFGYRVVVASSGEEAIEIYKQRGHEISLIILDLIMPGIGGEKCLNKIKEIDPSAKVIIASGFAPEHSTRKIIDSGALDFVNKPYDISGLISAVSRALGKMGDADE